MALFLSNTAWGEPDSETLEGGVSVINIKSDKIDYIQETDQFIATGDVVITVEENGTVIESDEVIYDKPNEQIISEKNVKITKDGIVTYGDYARFDLTKNSALLDNPDTRTSQIRIEATTGTIVSKNIELLKGQLTLDEKDLVMVLSFGATGGNGKQKLLQKRPNANPRFSYDIKAKEIIVEPVEYSNIITLKNATISINRFKIAKVPSLQLITDKETNRTETTLPEIGRFQELGFYAGYGHVFYLPKGSTLKTVPLFTFDEDGLGGGAMARFMSRTNRTEIYYSTLKSRVVATGQQQLFSPKTNLQYGANEYVDNGFFGQIKPKYMIEVVDNREIASAYNLRLSTRTSAGFLENYRNFATGKFQLQGSISNIKPLLDYDEKLSLGISSDFSLNTYGTGHSYGVVRAGPTLTSSLGRVFLQTSYYQGAIYGETPFLFDEYRYGKRNVVFNGRVKINDYITIGYIASLTLSRDNWENELLTENQFYIWVGPEDLKFRIGYDAVRERTLFGFDMLVGTEDSALEFEKLKVIQK